MEKNIKQELLEQTAKLEWRELQRFFAQGKLLHVSSDLDLIEVAEMMCKDHAQGLEPLLSSERVCYPSNAQAKRWFEANTMLWTVVVAPYVLVQERLDG